MQVRISYLRISRYLREPLGNKVVVRSSWMTQRERSRKTRQRWQGLLAEQGRSGHSVAAFCRKRKLCASHFFWWKKRLGASAATKLLEVKLAAAPPIPQFVGDPWVEVVLKNGRSLRVWPGFDRELVRALAAVLESEA